MSGPDPHKVLAKAAAKGCLPKNRKFSTRTKKKRTLPNTAAAWAYPESENLCELTFSANASGACVATIRAGDTVLLSATHPAAILAVMFLTNSAVQIKTTKRKGKFDPAWNLDSFQQAAMIKKLGFSKCPYLNLATNENEREWLDNLWLFSHDNYEKPSATLDEYIRSSQFYLHHQGLGQFIKRPLETPDPKGWAKTLKKRHQFTYCPDL